MIYTNVVELKWSNRERIILNIYLFNFTRNTDDMCCKWIVHYVKHLLRSSPIY
ncbi:hypothetical protein BDA96_08G151800 [Sorghum bicolor]|uniref:Uncharacterized protein n=1 Tax=Sorghum bicolor TaxID=4558 RepID=A0A921U7L8_SORBI|nr:hypothetical protein BDA96_08G151800 [Sorghum bicolor]